MARPFVVGDDEHRQPVAVGPPRDQRPPVAHRRASRRCTLGPSANGVLRVSLGTGGGSRGHATEVAEGVRDEAAGLAADAGHPADSEGGDRLNVVLGLMEV